MEVLDSPYFPPLAENISIRCNLLSAVETKTPLATDGSSSLHLHLHKLPPSVAIATATSLGEGGFSFLAQVRSSNLATQIYIRLDNPSDLADARPPPFTQGRLFFSNRAQAKTGVQVSSTFGCAEVGQILSDRLRQSVFRLRRNRQYLRPAP